MTMDSTSTSDTATAAFSARTIRMNLMVSAAGRAGSILLNLLTTILIIRALGDGGYGVYLVVINLVTFIDLAVEIPLFEIVTREIAKQPAAARGWMASATAIRGIVSLAASIVLIVCGALHVGGEPVLMFLGAALLLTNIFRTPINLFRAQMQLHWEMGPWCLSRLIELILVLAAIQFAPSPVWFVAARLAASILFVIIIWRTVIRRFGQRFRLSLDHARLLLYAGAPVALTTLLVLLQLKFDIFLIFKFHGKEAAGLFGAIAQIPEFSLIVNTVLIGTVGPLLARTVGLGHEAVFQSLFQRTFRSLILFLPACGAAAAVLAEPLMTLAFGSEFLPGANAFRIVVFASSLIPVAGLLGITAITLNLQRRLIRVELINVALYLLVNFLIMPQAGIIASAWVRLAVLILGNLNTYRVIAAHSPHRLAMGDLLPSMIITPVVTLLVYVAMRVHDAAGIVAAAILCGTLVYSGVSQLRTTQPGIKSAPTRV